jgi:hypothetical protein
MNMDMIQKIIPILTRAALEVRTAFRLTGQPRYRVQGGAAFKPKPFNWEASFNVTNPPLHSRRKGASRDEDGLNSV